MSRTLRYTRIYAIITRRAVIVVKRMLCRVLVLIMTLVLLPVTPISQAEAADVTETPVWKVAWVTVTEVNVRMGASGEIRNVTAPTDMMDAFVDTAVLFKNFIETHTGNAVEVVITHIAIDTVYEVRSYEADRIKFDCRMTPDMQEDYNITLEDYDVWIVGWPFYEETPFGGTSDNPLHNYYLSEVFGCDKGACLDGRECYIVYPLCYIAFDDKAYGTPQEQFLELVLHEFLHTTEYWFRDTLKYLLPVAINRGSILDSNFAYIDYPDDYPYAGEPFLNMYAAWLSCSLVDTKYPNSGHTTQYLGIPAEAWRYSPTNFDPDVTDIPQFTDPETGAILVPSRITNKPGVNLYSLENGYIDLTNEAIVIPDQFKIRSVLPTGKELAKMFDKGFSLQVTVTNRITDETLVLAFPQISARPKKPNPEKLKPYYFEDTWEMRTKSGATASSMYSWAVTTDKKTPNDKWAAVPDGGFALQSGKEKTVYLFRVAASVRGNQYTPGGKAFKVTPKNFAKEPNCSIKTDSKTGRKALKLKKNDCYQFEEEPPVRVTYSTSLDVTELTGTLTVWKGETGKKPRSDKKQFKLISTVAPDAAS